MDKRGPDTGATLEGNYPCLFAAAELSNEQPIRAAKALLQEPAGVIERGQQGWGLGVANNLIMRQQPRGIVGRWRLAAGLRKAPPPFPLHISF